MKLLEPLPPRYDPLRWRELPFPERMRLVCQAWALDGYGAPLLLYGLYLVKIAFLIGLWLFVCGRSPSLGPPLEVASWWAHPLALEKAVLLSLAWEGLGLGCGSGPLTGRYLPPVGGFLHWLRPGTTRLPLLPRAPLVGGHRRRLVDVGLYALHYTLLGRLLLSPDVAPTDLVPTLVLLPLLGVLDKPLFLAARSEHYLVALACFALSAEPMAATKWVWVGIWMWAATSKLNQHFPSVIAVMTSNSPMTRWLPALRRAMYRSFPDDLRPSRLAAVLAHSGTAVEYAFPVVLLLGDGGALTSAGLVVMVVFHAYITSNFPMAVPIEWNVSMVYGALVLFGAHADVSALAWAVGPHAGQDLLVLGVLIAGLVVVPLVGNLWPAHVSFLCSMRYYAGNWPFSIWLFRGDSASKLDRVVKAAPGVQAQLAPFYDEPTIIAVLGKVLAFRAMHLHGRVLHELLPRCVPDLDEREWLDGELVAGLVLGWNFGDGHLHDERLLAAVQEQCGFEEGELRCVFVESQPLFRPRMRWRLADAATGVFAEGVAEVGALLSEQPWPRVRAGEEPPAVPAPGGGPSVLAETH